MNRTVNMVSPISLNICCLRVHEKKNISYPEPAGRCGRRAECLYHKRGNCHSCLISEKDYERAVELISDITFNSVFPEKEIEKEKDVVIEEINSYLDNPSELIFDDFEELIYSNQPIGRNILGSPESVKIIFTGNDIQFHFK